MTRRAKVVVGAGTVLVLTTLTLLIVAIWTGDDRWGWTGGVLAIPTSAAAFLAFAAWAEGDL